MPNFKGLVAGSIAAAILAFAPPIAAAPAPVVPPSALAGAASRVTLAAAHRGGGHAGGRHGGEHGRRPARRRRSCRPARRRQVPAVTAVSGVGGSRVVVREFHEVRRVRRGGFGGGFAGGTGRHVYGGQSYCFYPDGWRRPRLLPVRAPRLARLLPGAWVLRRPRRDRCRDPARRQRTHGRPARREGRVPLAGTAPVMPADTGPTGTPARVAGKRDGKHGSGGGSPSLTLKATSDSDRCRPSRVRPIAASTPGTSRRPRQNGSCVTCFSAVGSRRPARRSSIPTGDVGASTPPSSADRVGATGAVKGQDRLTARRVKR